MAIAQPTCISCCLPRDAMIARYLLSSCVRPSVRSSQNGIVSKRLGGSSWYLAQSLPSVYPTLCCKEIWYFQKVKYLHVELCPKLRTLKNFATACSSRCQQNSSSSSSTVEFVDDIYATIDEARGTVVYYKSVSYNPLAPLLRFTVDLSYNLFLQFTKF